MFSPRYPLAVSVLAAAALVAAVWAGASTAGRLAAWALLMWAPGVALHAWTSRRGRPLESVAAALVLSPVVTGGLCALAMWAGLEAATAALAVAAAAALAAVSGAWRGRRAAGEGLARREWLVLGAVAAGTLALVGWLPLAHEWWRFRSDAWFHRAVVEQIADFGVPPQDPYFAGFELQYMWLYHVLVLGLSRATQADPFWIMPLVNLQSLAGVFAATMLFAGLFVSGFGRRVGSCLAVVFGLNGLVWLFLPFKAIRALTGEVRGVPELARTFSLSPFDLYTVKRFLTVYYNQEFFLDKFVVATALGLAFACMALFWWAAAAYLRSRRPFALAAAALALAGMLGYHTLFGVVMLAGAVGGLVPAWALRRRVDGFRLHAALELAAALAVAAAATSPYLYAITHLKGGVGGPPLGVSFEKIAGIVITCAGVIVLAAWQRSFFSAREVSARFVQFALVATALVCAVLVLPDSNTYDKLPLFVFYPLAVVGGWTLADLVTRRRPAGRRVVAALVVGLAFLAPVNALSFAAYFRTPVEPMYAPGEVAAAAWVRAHTSRTAVFIDRDEKVFLLVAGPRRYYCGKLAYARQWQYDRREMARRMHARSVLLGDGSLDLTTLRMLADAPWELYVVVRADGPANPVVARHPNLFRREYDQAGIALFRVDRAACAREAAAFEEAGRGEAPDDRLIRESGL